MSDYTKRVDELIEDLQGAESKAKENVSEYLKRAIKQLKGVHNWLIRAVDEQVANDQASKKK